MDYYYYDESSSEEYSEECYEEDIPLNGREVNDIVGEPIGGLLFSQAKDMDLEDMFKNDRCLINYHHKDNMGHWVAMRRDRTGEYSEGHHPTIYYFNPSGNTVDGAIDHLPKDYREETNQDYPHILKKLYDSDYKVKYMDYPIQKNNTNTCGRYCGLFLRYPLDENQFVEIFGKLSNDSIIRFTEALRGIGESDF